MSHHHRVCNCQLKTIFCTEVVGKFMTVLHVGNFMCLAPIVSLIIAIKPKSEHRFHAASILSYILYKNYQQKQHIFQQSVTKNPSMH